MSRDLPGARLEPPLTVHNARLQALAQEHGALVRLLGGLQRRVATLQSEHAKALGELQGEVLRLRAQMVASRTRVFWGLAAWGDPAPAAWTAEGSAAQPTAHLGHRPLPADRAPLAAAAAVICQTGCVGHAHPWRDADGQCRRTGEACDTAGVASPAEWQSAPRGG